MKICVSLETLTFGLLSRTIGISIYEFYCTLNFSKPAACVKTKAVLEIMCVLGVAGTVRSTAA